MILPSKHLREDRALITIGADLLHLLGDVAAGVAGPNRADSHGGQPGSWMPLAFDRGLWPHRLGGNGQTCGTGPFEPERRAAAHAEPGEAWMPCAIVGTVD